MALGTSNSETVIFRTKAGLDNYGERLPGGGVQTPVEGCLFAPGSTGETFAQDSQVTANAVLYAPAEAPALNARDEVVIRGEIYQVVGKPKLWSGEGWEINVQFVSG